MKIAIVYKIVDVGKLVPVICGCSGNLSNDSEKCLNSPICADNPSNGRRETPQPCHYSGFLSKTLGKDLDLSVSSECDPLVVVIVRVYSLAEIKAIRFILHYAGCQNKSSRFDSVI